MSNNKYIKATRVKLEELFEIDHLHKTMPYVYLLRSKVHNHENTLDMNELFKHSANNSSILCLLNYKH